jgi:hypothetical protein
MKSRRQVEAAVEEFNRYRSPEAVAKIEVNENQVMIEFSRPFCVSCGIEDYFDDLRIELEKNIGEKIMITKIEGGAEAEGYVVTFRKKSVYLSTRPP